VNEIWSPDAPQPVVAWHLLFPLGGAEIVRDKRQVWDDAWCRACVDADTRYAALTEAHGSTRKLIPVTEQHRHFEPGRPLEETRRVGSMRGLAYVSDGVHAPGVYGLIEWGLGSHMIRSRERDELSPTTVMRYAMTDGTEIVGPFIVEVGLVTTGAVQTIGNAYDDALPADTFVPGQVPSVDNRSFTVHDVECIMRAAHTERQGMAENQAETPAVESAPTDSQTPNETVANQRSDDGALEEMIKGIVSDAISALETRLDERYAPREVGMPKDEDPPMAEDDAEQRSILAAGRAACAATVRSLVTDGKIAVARSAEAVNRLVAGQRIDDMLIDGGLFTLRAQGVPSPGVTATPEQPKTRTYTSAEVDEMVLKRDGMSRVPYGAPKWNETFNAIKAELTAAGNTVEG
jgi:hypothetical protein